MGVEPGLSDVFARYAADHLFGEIDELGVRDGANLVVAGYDFAPSFSIWTTIEECLNPPVIWEEERGWFTTPPFSEPETFDFPEGIGPVECVNVEHEEVLLMPRWVTAKRATFKYGLGDEFINVLKVLHQLGLDRTAQSGSAGSRSPRATWWRPACPIRPRSVTGCPARPAPACGSPAAEGRGAARGLPLPRGRQRVVDARYGSQAVVWQTAINPVVALELLASGTWKGTGVLGPEAFDAVPFLSLKEYGSPWGMEDRTPHTGNKTASSCAAASSPGCSSSSCSSWSRSRPGRCS